MPKIDPAFLLDNPELVAPTAPWCVRLDNLELGTLLLAQPWLAGGGIGRADLERQLSQLARDLPLGPVYFQRVSRAVARLEQTSALRGRGKGRSRRFLLTPSGFAALILNLRVLVADPTVDGSEFELKRALVAMCNLVLQRVSELPGDVPADPEMDRFFDEAERLTVLGRRVITDEIVSGALDILELVEIQRRRILHLLDVAVDRLEELSAQADLLGGMDLARLPESLAPEAATPIPGDPATAGMVRSLATHTLPQLSLRATILRYRSYLDYLDRLTRLYTRELKVIDLETLRRLTGRRGA